MQDSKLLESILEKDGIIFLTYGGVLTQSLIVGMTEALEKESEQADLGMNIANKIFTIFIELSQNMMNYSKAVLQSEKKFDPKGMIMVGRDHENRYYIMSRNIVDTRDKEKIVPILQKIQQSDPKEIKRLYREARRSGQHSHEKGGGIGFYEIAKKADHIEYDFSKINDTKYYFTFRAVL